MSIKAKIEVENKNFLPIGLQGSGSKAIATFITALSDYCYSFDKKHVSMEEIVEWFSDLEAAMTENLCLLEHATYGGWDYSEGEYEQYTKDIKTTHEQTSKQDPPIADWLVGRSGYEEYLHKVTSENIDIFTREEFIQTCRQIESKWVNVNELREVVNDLVRVLEKLRPKDVWWYNEQDSLPDFKLFSETLSNAIERGFQQIRVYLS